ncbi:MAG: ATP-binding cassette domain-containing protein, partial [Erysipelotrichia bacterium]|nr:ATP-binding cassette domain-containing protein [Erysipelotrichia bacterium]
MNMILSANAISKYHNEKCILNKVSFAIGKQDKIALIGVNGTGKTTFLEIVAGLT